MEAVGVKIAHVRDGRVPLVEGPPVVNERLGSFLIRSRCDECLKHSYSTRVSLSFSC